MHVTIRSAGKLYMYNKAGVVTGEVRERETPTTKTSSCLSVEIVNYHDFAFVVYKKRVMQYRCLVRTVCAQEE